LALTRTDTSSAALERTARGRVRGVLAHAPDLATLAWAIPVAIAAVYVVVFVLSLSHNLARLAWNPSVSSAFTMAETLVKTGSGGATAMGSTPQWASLWFGLATTALPLHRALWEIAPTLLLLATALIVGWSVSRLADRRAAILAVLIGIVASPLALTFFMAPFSHNTVYPCTALLGAYLIWLTRERPHRRLTAIAVPPLLGVITGACLSSDFLLAATAVIPLTLAALLAALHRDRRSRLVALSALVTVVVAVPVAKITSSTMRSLGYLTLPTPVHHASLSELPSRARLLFKGLQALFNGNLGYEKPGALHVPLGIACDVVMSAALLALLVIGARATVGLIASGLRRGGTRHVERLARPLHIVYWVSAAAIPAAAFWVAGEGPVTTHESYYATSIFAVAAVLPLLLSSGALARVLIPAGASIVFAASLVGLKDNYIDISEQLAHSVPAITKIAAAYHVQVGYANWGDASPLTWSTRNRVIVRPVVECGTAQTPDLCPGFQAYVPSWYTPATRHTFLLVEAGGVDLNAAPASLGRPLAAYAFESMRMYIYPYDIASRFGLAVN
jgi:hypothetical protein